MRIAIAGFALESASIMPGEMGPETFEQNTLRGPQLVAGLLGTESVGGGFLDVLQPADAEIVPLVYCDAGAAGHASDAAFEAYAEEICAGLAARRTDLDGVLLFLHGAMTTPTRDDPEGELLSRVRRVVGLDMPVVVALDLHGNLTPDMIRHCTAAFGYRYSPHTDMRETGARAARCLVRTLRGEIAPVTVIAKAPVALPSIFTATALAPLSDIVSAALRRERNEPGLIDLSIFCGFAYADVPQVGFSVVAVGDGEAETAARIAEDFAARIHARRHALLHRDLVHGIDDGIARAMALHSEHGRPAVLLEHADRMNDSTWLLRALVERRARRVAVPYLWDPRAAGRCVAAGAGARLNLEIGGQSSARAGGALEIAARVLWAGNKSYVGTGPMRRGRRIDLGPSALIDADGIVISLTTASLSAIDEDPFLQFGLDARDFDLIVLRSKTHFRAVYEDLAAGIVIVDTPDWGTADLASLPYRKVGPGVFPITSTA